MLERFVLAKQEEIKRLRFLADKDALPAPWPKERPGFTAALRARFPQSVIAEYKRASPSHGAINLTASLGAVVSAYAEAGAAALSILTEENHFQGHVDFLDQAYATTSLPLLRKDFILDPLQIVQTRATPAAAVLLITRMLTDAALELLLRECSRYGLEAITEIFDENDLARAKASGADILQVNNRDLDSLRVDLAVSRRLIKGKSFAGSTLNGGRGEFWISASGISRPEELREMTEIGFDAVLVGSSLMRGENPGANLRRLLGGEKR